MKKFRLLSLLIIPAALLASCDAGFSIGGNKEKGANIRGEVQVEEWNAVFDPVNFVMHTNFVHEVTQTLTDGRKRAFELFETNYGKLHVKQEYYLMDAADTNESGEVKHTKEGYWEFKEVKDRTASGTLYARTDNQEQFAKSDFADLDLDFYMFANFGLFPLDFEKCTYDSETKTYTSESIRFDWTEYDAHLGYTDIKNCKVKFKNSRPVSYDFDFESIYSSGTLSLAAHDYGVFSNYGKADFTIPEGVVTPSE